MLQFLREASLPPQLLKSWGKSGSANLECLTNERPEASLLSYQLHSDQGRSFETAVIHQLCKLNDIHKSKTTACHPEGNGQCERFNVDLHNLRRALPPEEKRKWPDSLLLSCMLTAPQIRHCETAASTDSHFPLLPLTAKCCRMRDGCFSDDSFGVDPACRY